MDDWQDYDWDSYYSDQSGGGYDQYGYDAAGNFDYEGAMAGAYDFNEGDFTTDYYGNDPGAGDAFDYSYSGYNYEDLGDGFWYDPESGGVYDAETQEWSFEEAAGYLGDGETTETGDGGFTDPFGNTFYADGSIEFPDGSRMDPAGNMTFDDGTQLLAGGDFVDEHGQTWENMAWAGAPNSWQNVITGDVWNNSDGTLVESVESGYVETAGQVVGTSPKPTSSPGGGSSGGGPGGGSSAGQPKPAAATSNLNDINNLLKTLLVAKQTYDVAKAGGNTSAAQLAQLRAQAAAAAQNVAAAKAGQATSSIPKEAIWIAGGLAALFLVSTLARPSPAPAYAS